MSTPAPVVNGKSGAYEGPRRYGYDDNGPYTIRTWGGTKSAIETQYALCVTAGAACEVREGYGTYTLEARYSTDADGTSNTEVDTWEFFANSVEKDMLEADISIVRGISADYKRTIQNWTDPDSAPVLDSGGNASKLLNLRMKGTKSVVVMQPMLRHTKTVSNGYSVKASMTGVGKIWTNAQISSFEELPATVLFNLPTDGTAETEMLYGWLKLHPTVRIAAGQKVQIEQEFQYGYWTSLLYSAYA
jgi:hypothetical protein